MFFRQNRDTFIRTVGPYGYVVNQTTKHDRVFSASGQVFLSEFSREPRTVEDAVTSLLTKFDGASQQVLRNDFIDFVRYLEKHRFAVSGTTAQELDAKDQCFSYAMDNPKTFTFDFRQSSDDDLQVDDTQDYLNSYLRNNPTLWDFQMEVTSRCNERCVHCYIPHASKEADIDLNFAIGVIDQAADMGVINITFSGGEATLHRHLPELLRKARQRDLSITVLSNLVSVPDTLLEAMVEVGMNLVQVSVYSMKPEEHDLITQLPGSLEKTLQNIERLINADIPVQVSCPVMKINYRSYKDVLNWAYQRKIKAYTDFIMMARTDQTTENLDQRIGETDAREMLQDIIAIDEDYRVMVNEEPETRLFMDQQDKPVCGVGINTLCMVSDGKCYPCAGWQGYIVGDLTRSTLRDIWEISPELEYLRTIKRGDFSHCQGCADQNYCAMCMVRNFNETGDIFNIPDHFCHMAKVNREVVEQYSTTKRVTTK